MPSKAGSRILFVAAAAALVGCSDSPSGPGSPSVPDVAELLTEMSSSALSSAAAIASPRIGPALSASALDPSTCRYSATSGFFECPTTTVNGLTFTRSFRLIDGAGNPQSAPDTHTSAIETKTTVDGTVSTSTPAGPGGIATSSNYTLHANSDRTLSGVRTNAHTLNGASLTSISGTIQLGTDVLPIDQTISETTTNLVLPNAKAGQRWPQSGTISIETMLGTAPASGTSKMEITFNGTSVVTITTTSSFGTTTCHVDLANPAGSLSFCLTG
jgi:hypothetical protein